MIIAVALLMSVSPIAKADNNNVVCGDNMKPSRWSSVCTCLSNKDVKCEWKYENGKRHTHVFDNQNGTSVFTQFENGREERVANYYKCGVKSVWYHGNGKKRIEATATCADGKSVDKIKTINYDEEEKETGSSIAVQNEAGRLLKITRYDKEGKLIETTTPKYDEEVGEGNGE